MDEIARQIGRDPVDVRRINLISADSMPFDRQLDAIGTEVVYDSGVYESLLDELLRYVNYDSLRVDIASRKLKGECVGLGMAYFGSRMVKSSMVLKIFVLTKVHLVS